MYHIHTAHPVGGIKGIFNLKGRRCILEPTHIGLLACRCWQMQTASVTELFNFTMMGAVGGRMPIFGWMI